MSVVPSGQTTGLLGYRERKPPGIDEGFGNDMPVLAVILVALFALIVVASFVIAFRRNPSWPRKPHLGHWRKWDDD